MKRSMVSGWAPYLFLSPFLLIMAVFLVYPLFQSMWLAGQQTFGPDTTRFVGLKNFIDLYHDELFWKAMKNTLLYAMASVFIQLPLSLGLALLLNHPRIRGRNVLRLIFFSPSLIGIVFVAMMFTLIFHEQTGLLNAALQKFIPHFPREFPWLQHYVMPAMILASLWMYVGFNMMYFLAALQGVDRTLLDAAEVDGANAWQRFRHITLPSMMPVAGFVTLISIIGSMQLFELPYILLGGAGPENRGLTVVMYLFQYGFQIGDLGYASAIGWSLALLLMVVALVQRRLSKEDAE